MEKELKEVLAKLNQMEADQNNRLDKIEQDLSALKVEVEQINRPWLSITKGRLGWSTAINLVVLFAGLASVWALYISIPHDIKDLGSDIKSTKAGVESLATKIDKNEFATEKSLAKIETTDSITRVNVKNLTNDFRYITYIQYCDTISQIEKARLIKDRMRKHLFTDNRK